MAERRAFAFSLLLALILAPAVSGAAPAAGRVTDEILRDFAVPRGIGVDLTGDALPAIELLRRSEFRVYRIEADERGVAQARRTAEAAGLSPTRIRAERGPLAALAYPTYCANFALADAWPIDAATLRELGRILRPGGFLYVLQPEAPAASMRPALEAAGVAAWTVTEKKGLGYRLGRPALEGAGEWTHYFHNPTNNRYSEDPHIRAPFRMLWYGEPVRLWASFWCGHCLAAGGRIICTDMNPADLNTARLTALDAYNGTPLWSRPAGGPRFTRIRGVAAEDASWLNMFQVPGAVHPNEMVATAERVYLADSTRCLVVDAATGKDLGEIAAPPPTDPTFCWRYVGIVGDTLFGYADAPDTAPRIWAKAAPRKGGHPTLFALDRSSGRAKWVRGGKPDDPLGPSLYPPLAIGDGWVYVRSGTSLAALDSDSGATVWSVPDLDPKDEETWWEGVAHDGKLYLYQFSIRTYGAKAALWTRVFAAKDGARLGEKKRGDPDVYFSSAEKICRTPPGAGTAAGCIYATAAGNVSFGRNGYALEGRGVTPYGGFRGACRVGVLPAHGLVLIPANSHTHDCTCVPFRATIALEPGAALEKVTDEDLCVQKFPAQLPEQEVVPAGETDWPTLRADAARTAVTQQDLSQPFVKQWEIPLPGALTAPIAVGDRVYLGSTDECVYALDAASGKTAWRFYTAGPVRTAPAHWNGRLYAGSDDGWVYCLRASTGEALWRVRCAPPARQQIGFGAIVSPWPVRQGLAVEGGTLYVTVGLVSPGVNVLALDAEDGRLRWRRPLSHMAPCGTIAVGDERLYVPSEPGGGVFQLDRADGKLRRGGIGTQVCYIRGRDGDAEDLHGGFAVHGGGEVLGLNRQEPRTVGWAYDLLPTAGDTEPRLVRGKAPVTAFADERSFLPVVGDRAAYFMKRGELVAVDRADLWKMTLVRERKGDERDGFLRWRAKDLPCGEPIWLVLAAGTKDTAAATILAGGPKGVTAVDAGSGAARWSVPVSGSPRSPAVAGGWVFVTTGDGRLVGLGPTESGR